MKILVPVKRVVDAKVKVKALPDASDVDLSQVKMAMNPFDEIAMEAAVRLREHTGSDTEIVAVSIGGEKTLDTLRVAMALGADRSIHVQTDERLEPLAIAKVLKKVVDEEQPDLVLLGKQAIDDDASQVGQMLSALAQMPLATFASALTVQEGIATVVREVDKGTHTVQLRLPAVVTADLRLAEPRYVTLPMMGKARKKPVDVRALESFGLDVRCRLQRKAVTTPLSKKAGVRVNSVQELVEKLKNEAHVL